MTTFASLEAARMEALIRPERGFVDRLWGSAGFRFKLSDLKINRLK